MMLVSHFEPFSSDAPSTMNPVDITDCTINFTISTNIPILSSSSRCIASDINVPTIDNAITPPAKMRSKPLVSLADVTSLSINSTVIIPKPVDKP